MNVGESKGFNALSGASLVFSLRGGVYVLSAVSSTWNSATTALQIEGPDNATFTNVVTLAANGITAPQYLPAGSYKISNTGTATGTIYATVASVQF